MKMTRCLWLLVMCLLAGLGLSAQQQVPRLIKFSGMLRDLTGKPLTGPVDVNFAIYKERADLVPLWYETQTLQLDEEGRYTALLGAMQAEGLPMALFTSGEARWLEVYVPGAEPQPRILLVSVPYALKAGDAETLGGKPASAFVPISAESGPGKSVTTAVIGDTGLRASTPELRTGGRATPQLASGTPGYLAKFTSTTDLGDSAVFESGGNVGIATTGPISTLDVWDANVHAPWLTHDTAAALRVSSGAVSLVGAVDASSPYGFWLQTRNRDIDGSFYALDLNPLGGNVGIGTTGPISTLDVWDANVHAPSLTHDEAAALRVSSGAVSLVGAVDASSPYGFWLQTRNRDIDGSFYALDLNPLGGNVGIGTTAPGEKLEVAGNVKASGSVTAASFSGGTLTGTQLISTVASGTAPLSVTSNTLVPNLNADLLDGFHASAFQPAGAYAILGGNTFTATQTISSGGLSVSSGNISLPQTASASAGVINLGGAPFMHACCSASQHNTFIGVNAGNFTTTGSNNFASGEGALAANTSGNENSAIGTWALHANTTGSYNHGTGNWALQYNTEGIHNTANGVAGLYRNTTGSYNTGNGYGVLYYSTTGSANTGVGFEALRDNCKDVTSGCTGDNNTAIGYLAGVTSTSANANVTGANNTFIGYQSGPGTSTQLDNAVAIGANALVSASNALVLGGTGSNAVSVGIGTETPAARLQVVDGDVYASTAGKGVIVKSPDGNTCARIGIDNSGALSVTSLTSCP